jgi:hypothetical protein
MKNILRSAVQLKKLKWGIYKKGNKHLYELTLSDLENEYKYIEKKSSDRNKKWNLNPL